MYMYMQDFLLNRSGFFVSPSEIQTRKTTSMHPLHDRYDRNKRTCATLPLECHENKWLSDWKLISTESLRSPSTKKRVSSPHDGTPPPKSCTTMTSSRRGTSARNVHKHCAP